MIENKRRGEGGEREKKQKKKSAIFTLSLILNRIKLIHYK